jgi:Spy/CpxP family protein refolding chaperone
MLEKRTWLLFAMLAVVAALPLSTRAQQDADNAPPATDAAADDGESRRLPNFFGRLAVSDAQREDLLSIQDDYEVKIDELRDQIRALVRERDAAMEAKLTPGQKTRLAELREEARLRAAEEEAAAEETPPPATDAPGEDAPGESSR